MTKNSLSGLAKQADLILRESAPNFDFSKIADLGRSGETLSSQEADRLAVRGQFPDELMQAILSCETPPETTAPFTRQHLLDAFEQDYEPARTAPNTRLPGPFGKRHARAQPVELMRGGPSRHNLINFCKTSFNPTGQLFAFNDAQSALFARYLDVPDPCALEGHAFLGIVEGSAVYTHWLLDTLPRLLLLTDSGRDLSEFDSFYFATVGTRFHKATLETLGIPLTKVKTRHIDGPFISCEQFSMVTAPRSAFTTHPRVYDLVRSHFMASRSAEGSGRRLFVSRRNAKRRRILNESDLMAMLDRYGFEPIAFEDYSIGQTAQIMAGASHIVSPHGAGLANLIFAAPGARVLELYNAHLSPEYWQICTQGGLEYHAVETLGPDGTYLDPDTLTNTPFFERNGMDLLVDIPLLDAYLSSTFLV